MFLPLVAALATLSSPAADPLAPARDGKQLCFNVDGAARTCTALSSYEFAADGGIVMTSDTVVSVSPRLVLTTRTPVVIKDGAECSSAAGFADQITGIQYEGTALTGDILASARQQVATEAAKVIGGDEVCSTYVTGSDGALTAVTTVDGVAKPEMSGPVEWIEPTGWTLAAAGDGED